eukprot:129909_1
MTIAPIAYLLFVSLAAATKDVARYALSALKRIMITVSSTSSFSVRKAKKTQKLTKSRIKKYSGLKISSVLLTASGNLSEFTEDPRIQIISRRNSDPDHI